MIQPTISSPACGRHQRCPLHRALAPTVNSKLSAKQKAYLVLLGFALEHLICTGTSLIFHHSGKVAIRLPALHKGHDINLMEARLEFSQKTQDDHAQFVINPT